MNEHPAAFHGCTKKRGRRRETQKERIQRGWEICRSLLAGFRWEDGTPSRERIMNRLFIFLKCEIIKDGGSLKKNFDLLFTDCPQCALLQVPRQLLSSFKQTTSLFVYLFLGCLPILVSVVSYDRKRVESYCYYYYYYRVRCYYY